jgi:hypothetical protein
MAERDYEAEAKEQGWNPDPESLPEGKWTDAKTFVEKGEKIAGILKSRLDRQDAQIKKLQDDNKSFGEWSQKLLDKEKKRSADLLAELEAQRATAITDGDGQEFTRVDREIQRVRQDISAPAPTNGQELDPVAQAWLLNNDWYNNDEDLQIYADGISERVAQEGYVGQAYFKELTSRVKARFPEKFENPRRSRANDVEAGGELQTQGSTPHSYENLPADAKAACDRFVASGLITKEKYVEDYEWDD